MVMVADDESSLSCAPGPTGAATLRKACEEDGHRHIATTTLAGTGFIVMCLLGVLGNRVKMVEWELGLRSTCLR